MLSKEKGVYYEKSPMIYLQVLRHSSLSRLRQLILTASLVSVVTLKGLCSGQAPSYIHLFSFLLLSYGRAKSSFRQFNTNFPESENIYADFYNQFLMHEIIHIILIYGCNHIFSFCFIQVIFFAELLHAYKHSE